MWDFETEPEYQAKLDWVEEFMREKVEPLDGQCRLTAPRLLNGAQTVTTVAGFRSANKDNPKLAECRRRGS